MANRMTNMFNGIGERLDAMTVLVQDYLDRLQPRERIAVIILAIFLSVTVLVSLLWFPHQAALKQQQRVTELKDTIHWMQTNAVQLSTESADALTAAEKVQRVAQQQGLSVQSQENQDQIKLSTSHQNYAVLANFLTQLAQQGVSIITLDMQKQPSGEIQLTATLQ
ncbi:type II secretion system protein GspM [Acinetobacter populi]